MRVRHVPATPLVLRVVRASGWVRAGRVGTRVGYTGGVPTEHAEEPTPGMYSEAGPGSPIGAGVGGTSRAGVGGPCTTLRARSVSLQDPSLYRTLECRLWANKGEIQPHLL